MTDKRISHQHVNIRCGFVRCVLKKIILRFRFPNWTPVRFLQYSVNPNVCGHNRKVDEVLGKHGAAFQPKAN